MTFFLLGKGIDSNNESNTMIITISIVILSANAIKSKNKDNNI